MAVTDIPSRQDADPTPGQILVRRALGHRGITIGATLVLAITVLAVLAPVLAAHDPYQQDLFNRLQPPVWHTQGDWGHLLGTDHLGRDYFARRLYGAQISLMIGFGTVLIAGAIGTVLGVAAGYFGGRVDMVVTFLISVRLSTPIVLVSLAVIGGWLSTGFYRLELGEEALSIQLGQTDRTVRREGLNWPWPEPIGRPTSWTAWR